MNLPYLLIFFRLMLAPTVLILAYYVGESSRIWIMGFMYLGLFSDVFDGIIARKMGLSTERMRRMDSQTDLIFWTAIAISCYLLFPIPIKEHMLLVTILIVMEVLCYLVSFAKFGKETCTHAFLSKLWGVCLLIAFTSLLGFEYAGWVLKLTILFGLVSQLDVVLIILLLPRWMHDIPSCYHAYLIRQGRTIKKHKLLNS